MNKDLLQRAGRAKVFLFWAVVFGALAAVATIAQMIFLSEVVGRAFLYWEGLEDATRPLAFLLCAVVARSVFVWLREVVALRGAVRAKRALRERLLDHLRRLGPVYSGGERTGELVTTAVEGVERLEAYFARYLPQVALSALVPVLIAGYVLVLDPLSAAVLLATAPAIVVLMVLVGGHAEKHTRLQWEALSRMGAHFLDVLRGLPTLKAFGRAADERGRVAGISAEFGRRTLEVLRVAFVSGLALEFVATVSVGLIAVLLGVRLLFSDLPFEVAFPVLLLAPEFYRPLRELGASRHAGMEGKAAATRISEVLDTPFAHDEADGSIEEEPRVPLSIEFRDVSFSYPESTHPALSGVDLVLPAGTRTALVGPSGAGKSTLVNLLLRFAKPQSGRILANGVPVADLAVEDWREMVALVPQRPHLFYGSVLDNLRLARPQASREEIEHAAKLAGAHGFVRRFPQGYDTHIGERAVRLSEGEAQRLAIARAFLKDAPVLVMDEPASGLDPESERLIQEALERLARERTVLVIAHRLGAARSADRLAVLEGGRVAEVGTHADLAGSGGPYDRLLSASSRSGEGEIARTSEWRSDVLDGSLRDELQDLAGREGTHGPEEPGGEGTHARARTLTRLLGFLTPRWRRVALAVSLGVWTMGSNVGLLALSGYLIAAAALRPPLSELIPAAVLVQVFGGSRAFSRYADRLISHEVTFGLLADLRAWLYERLEPLSPARLTRRRGGDLLSRLVDDVEELQNVYLGAISPAVVATTVSIIACATLYAFDPSLALTTLAFLALAGVGVPLAVGALERGLGRKQVSLRAALVSELAEWLWGLRDLLAFGQARERQHEIVDIGRKLGRAQQRVGFATGLREAVHDLSAGLAVCTVLVLAVPLVEEGQIGGVYLALLALVALASFEAVRPLGEAFQSLGSSLAAGERLFEISDSEPAVSDPEKPLAIPADHALRFDRVTFRYGEDEPPVLEDVSFDLAPGKRVAVVGPSGAGKSTLVNLLLRFWDPTRGSIRLGGNDARAYAQEDLRSVFSVAAQDAHLFDATLRENLLLAKPDASDEELWSALAKAQLRDFANDLPHGLKTRVGESGSRLSGGERRRLAVARAFLKDAPLLVLDEPTADLDAGTERCLLDAVYEHTRGRGLLLITHRLVGMERMDEVLVLESGRIAERGTHEELMETGSAYRRMVEVQDQMLASR